MKKKVVFGLLLVFSIISQVFAAPCGDVNSSSEINIVDALMIAQYYVGLEPQGFDTGAADVSGDGIINIIDALQIAQYYVGLISSFAGCSTHPPVETVFAVNCGGSAYTSADGTQYNADTGFSGGSVYENGASVSGTSDGPLYSTERYGNSSYAVSVPNGEYQITLHFSENYHTSSGSRVFNVLMEGVQVIRNLDIYAVAGGKAAYVIENQIWVSDGEINIEFVTVTENALINAIKIDALSYTGEPIIKSSVNPSNPEPGEAVTVDLSASFDPDGTIAAYRVDYGDGYVAGSAISSHSYSEGTYTMLITITDNEGKTSSKSIEIVVKATPTPPPAGFKPRTIVTSDLGADPDDEQSWVHLLVCANEFDLEALVVSTSCWKKSQSNTSILDKILNAYDQAYANLSKHAEGFPTPSYLKSISGMGQTGYSMSAVGSGKDSFGSNAIIAAVDKEDPRPVWVQSWGGSNTVAQALWKVQSTRSASEVARFVSKLRVYDILGQDEAGAWITKNFPDLIYIRFIGVYNWQFSDSWIDSNVQNHGALGGVYPDRKYATEGDSPAFFYLLPNGLSNPDKVDWGSWGGRCNLTKKANLRGMSAVTSESQYDTYYMYSDAPEGGSSISKWKTAIQNNFGARMDWSVNSSYGSANHHPIAVVNNDTSRQVLEVSASAGTTVSLSAAGSSDPDKNSLSYSWSYYSEPSSYSGSVSISNSSSANASVSIPSNAGGRSIHIILTLTDNGSPSLTAYRRVVINVK